MTKKNFGWVLYDTNKEHDGYCSDEYGTPYVKDIKHAHVYGTRKDVRYIHIIGTDRILKVSLDVGGRPVAVIGRG